MNKKVDLTAGSKSGTFKSNTPPVVQLDSTEYIWHDQTPWAGFEDGYARLVHELGLDKDIMDPLVSARIAFDRVDEIITEEQVQLRRAIVNHFSKLPRHAFPLNYPSSPTPVAELTSTEIGPDLSDIGQSMLELTQEFNPIAELEESDGNPEST